jgi:large subunit ribosomal protein L22
LYSFKHRATTNFNLTYYKVFLSDICLFILQFSNKDAAKSLEKLLRSAIANWEQKNEEADITEENLIVSKIEVGGGAMLKRIQPAPQGRAHRIRKRSNHVTIVVGGAK